LTFSEIAHDRYIMEKMQKFKLVDMRERYNEIIETAIQDKLGYKDFLVKLLQVEDAGKNRRLVEKLVRNANFEFIKTLDEIEYEFNETINYQKVKELGTLSFMDNHENIIIIGPPGVGKSMIATGIGLNACQKDRTVLFVNANDLMEQLVDALKKGQLRQELNKLNKIEILIIDELSYIKMDKEKESIFFQIIRQRYEKRSLIITTNLPLGRWNEIFTGEIAATAILDRLLHHCHVLSITGDSFRVKGEAYLLNQESGAIPGKDDTEYGKSRKRLCRNSKNI
jgi:DNA replication protein DnaC